jgi:hypothetical protein
LLGRVHRYVELSFVDHREPRNRALKEATLVLHAAASPCSRQGSVPPARDTLEDAQAKFKIEYEKSQKIAS